MDQKARQNEAMNNARASALMEGLKITPVMSDLCRKVLDGKMSFNDSIAVYRKARKQQGE